jgi:hypothetical protein
MSGLDGISMGSSIELELPLGLGFVGPRTCPRVWMPESIPVYWFDLVLATGNVCKAKCVRDNQIAGCVRIICISIIAATQRRKVWEEHSP